MFFLGCFLASYDATSEIWKEKMLPHTKGLGPKTSIILPPNFSMQILNGKDMHKRHAPGVLHPDSWCLFICIKGTRTRTRTTRIKGICQPFKALTCWRSAENYYNIRTWHNHTSPTIAPHLNKGSLQMAFSLYQCAFASCPMMMVWGS